MSYDPFRNYDAWKTAAPEEYDWPDTCPIDGNPYIDEDGEDLIGAKPPFCSQRCEDQQNEIYRLEAEEMAAEYAKNEELY